MTDRPLKERIRIHLAAKRKLGMKDLSHYLFMQQCMEQMVNNGEADTEDDARDICELLWDEGGDPEEYD